VATFSLPGDGADHRRVSSAIGEIRPVVEVAGTRQVGDLNPYLVLKSWPHPYRF